MYRPKLAQVIIVILMLAVLSTAALIHLIWQRVAGENIEEIVASLDAQTAASVRNDLSRTLSLVSSTAEVVRSIFFQGAISANDEVKREFLFLSLLRDQRLSYTAIGDTVNLASRLVNVAKEGGVEIVLSDATMHELGEEPITRPLGVATVRGVYTIDQPQVRSAGGSDGNGNHDGGDARLPATQALRR